MRLGIGRPDESTDSTQYVIGPVSREDGKILNQSILKSAKAVVEIVRSGIDEAMNKFN